MDQQAETPIEEQSVLLEHAQFARLSAHRGNARFTLAGETFLGAAELVLPASGQPIISFTTHGKRSDQDFANNLVVEGQCSVGPFTVTCPSIYVRNHKGMTKDGRNWSVISPVNAPARIEYRHSSAATRVVVLMNDFDYECGDVAQSDGGWTCIATPFTASIGSRSVTFRHTALSHRVRVLAAAGVLPSASLVECSFSLEDGDSDDALLRFCSDVAALCTFAAGGTVGVAMMTFVDAADNPVRRILPQPVRSRYRRNEIIDDRWLPQFLQIAYPGLLEMKRGHRPWQKLASYCGCLQDAPYMEQKFASLMMAIEFVARNCLVERGHSHDVVTSMDLPKLFGAARRHLGWNLPIHTTRDTLRLWRNAVLHGDEWPESDSAKFSQLFHTWRLFLFRWVLMRLGYQGEIISPHKGWRATSPVNEFSEEHNSFAPPSPKAVDPWRELKNALKGTSTDHERPAEN